MGSISQINFQPFTNVTRSKYVFEEIKNAIFAGKLSPGTSLKELKLAKQFDVSQSIIREAIFMLEQVGLAAKIPHKGTSVTKLSDKEIKERIEIRTCLEKIACHKAIKNMNNEDFEHANKLVKDISKAQIKNLYYEASIADLNFHRYLWKKAENEILYKTLDQIATPLFSLVSVKRSINSQNLEEVMYSHEEYIKALKAGKEKRIDEIIYTHLTLSYKLAGIELD
ncbi:FCD domain-containing protein [candidate division KSB1 bacterium]|nr:FCD domain-containing protein [candidate division KSB1 bacterium]